MSRIRVPITAYILGLFPQSMNKRGGNATPPSQGLRLQTLEAGLAIPSFWNRTEITQAFDEANRLWLREAEIEFSPIEITERTEVVPADEQGMWIHFINHLTPTTRGIGVGFVYDLPAQEGGWGGGRIAVVAGKTIRSGLPGFAGNLLAHELGHVLIDDPGHVYAGQDPSNLMSGIRNPRVANAGLLNQQQVNIARRRAQGL